MVRINSSSGLEDRNIAVMSDKRIAYRQRLDLRLPFSRPNQDHCKLRPCQNKTTQSSRSTARQDQDQEAQNQEEKFKDRDQNDSKAKTKIMKNVKLKIKPRPRPEV